jgi:hypothetical protein
VRPVPSLWRGFVRASAGSTEAANGRVARVGRHADEWGEKRESIAQDTKVRGSLSKGAPAAHAYVASRTGPFDIVGPYRAGNASRI